MVKREKLIDYHEEFDQAQTEWYLVNKPLQAAGMSADNVRGWESEKWTFGREAKLRGQMWNFEDNLSAKDIISRHTSKPERGLFIL